MLCLPLFAPLLTFLLMLRAHLPSSSSSSYSSSSCLPSSFPHPPLPRRLLPRSTSSIDTLEMSRLMLSFRLPSQSPGDSTCLFAWRPVYSCVNVCAYLCISFVFLCVRFCISVHACVCYKGCDCMCFHISLCQNRCT